VPTLLTIPISHFCEKARWALDRAGHEYVEERHVQGPSRLVSRRAGGTGTLPVLVTPLGNLVDSDDILAWADPSLRAADPEVRTLCRWLDDNLGIPDRRLIYAHILPHRDLLMSFNNNGAPRTEALVLRAFWAVIAPWAATQLGAHPQTIERDEALTLHAFDAVAAILDDGRPYLCGDAFTAADLTFAALSAPVTAPPLYGTPLPQPEDSPPPVAALIRRFRAHPAGEFALRLYREERTAACAAATRAMGTRYGEQLT
jgi:glutathione S-transferase